MSTLVVSNISDGTTTVAASYVTNGSAKAWVNFNGTGTIAARDSLNLSSLTDNATGDFSINFSNAFGAADYATSGFTGNDNVNGTVWVCGPPNVALSSWKQTGLTRMVCTYANTLLTDCADVCLINHGDLA